MAYTPDNNPYIPGDPYSYDLKWQVDNIKHMQTRFGELDEQVQEATDQADRAEQEADRAAGRADFATEEAGRATQQANNAAASAEDAAGKAEDAAASEAAAKNYADNIADPVSGLVTTWLTQHITQPTTPAIDTSLTVAGAAADAKATGDIVLPLISRGDIVTNTAHEWINRYDRTVTPDPAYTASDYIPIISGKKYWITAAKQSSNQYDCSMVVYDDQQAYVRFSTAVFDNTEWTADITGYIRLVNYGGAPVCLTEGVFVNDRLDKLEADMSAAQPQIADNTEKIEDLAEDLTTWGDLVENTEHAWINRYDRVVTADIRYTASDYIPITAGKVYRITTARMPDNAYDCSMLVFNEQQVFVRFYTTTFDNTEWTADINGYIRLVNYGGAPVCLTEGVFVNDRLDKLEAADDLSSLRRKQLLWLGTSIPAGSKNNITVDDMTVQNNYPAMIAKMLDCDIINNAVGTSTLKTGDPARISVDDPMGIKHVQWQMATLCLTQTTAEKNSIISEWDAKWGPTGTYNLYQAPATLSDAQKTAIRNSSYEVLLMPYINGTYPMPDYFVIDHGWNDGAYYNAETADDMIATPPTRTDKHYFVGAFTFIVLSILQANPRAKIFVIEHFDNQARPWVNKAQRYVANEWEFALCPLAEISGISLQQLTVEGVDTTIKNIYCPDGIHPHSDTTGETNMMLARKIGKWLRQIW